MSFVCNICQKSYNRNRHLRLHIARQHTDKCTWTHRCEKCNKTYADSEILNRHMKMHINQFLCSHPECDKVFSSISAMHKHRRNFHLNQDNLEKKSKKYCCNECSASFSKHHLLSQHTFVHTGVLPFKCNKCEKRFLTLSHRNRHEKIHNGYLCEKCNKKLDSWSQLQSHITKNHPKLFKCSKCDKVFTMSCRLREHSAVHSTERKVYKCNKCDKTFVKKSNLNKHFKIVHLNEKPFKCDFEGCGKEFGYKHTLQKHKKVHQPDYKQNLCRTGKKKVSLISRLTGIKQCFDVAVKVNS